MLDKHGKEGRQRRPTSDDVAATTTQQRGKEERSPTRSYTT